MKNASLSRKLLAALSLLLLLFSLLPLYGIAFYNHPFYDDFGFSLRTRAAWLQTSSLPSVLKAAWQNTTGIRHTWEGTYTTSFISALQPGIFGESYYWIATFFLLTSLLLSLLYFLRQTLYHGLKLDTASFLTIFSLTAFVMVQFVPDPSEAFFWFNGGVAYSFGWALSLCYLGGWLSLQRSATFPSTLWRFILLFLATLLAGGCKYSTVLVTVLCTALFTLWSFLAKQPKKWLYLTLTLLLLFCFAFSMAAPGNAVRARTLQGGMSPVMAIAQSLFFGIGLMGQWFSLPLFATALLAAALACSALRSSSWGFAHPCFVTIGAGCLFCAGLSPTLYTGNFLGDGRLLDTYFFTYVLLFLGLVLYWTGWFLRQWETSGRLLPSFSRDSKRISLPLLLLTLVFFVLGTLSFRPEGTDYYAPGNTTTGSAALSLLQGEARQYHTELSARDAVLNDPSQPAVLLSPVTVIPKVFMSDALQSPNLDYVLSLYAEYYQKESVSLTPEGE